MSLQYHGTDVFAVSVTLSFRGAAGAPVSSYFDETWVTVIQRVITTIFFPADSQWRRPTPDGRTCCCCCPSSPSFRAQVSFITRWGRMTHMMEGVRYVSHQVRTVNQ